MTKEIRLTQGKIALVDDEDFEWLNQWRWHCRSRYAARMLGKKNVIYMHRLIAKTPEKMQTDHIDNNGLNNQRNNLRVCTRSQNAMNSGKQLNNTSGYKGVTWRKSDRTWRAQLNTGGGLLHLGRFDNPKDAALAYDEKARELFGEFAKTNF